MRKDLKRLGDFLYSSGVNCLARVDAVHERVYLATLCDINLGYSFGWSGSPISNRLQYDLDQLLVENDINPTILPSLEWQDDTKIKKFTQSFIDSKPGGCIEAEWVKLLASLHWLLNVWNFDEESADRLIAKTIPGAHPWFSAATAALENLNTERRLSDIR